jgi:hypothetical protein
MMALLMIFHFKEGSMDHVKKILDSEDAIRLMLEGETLILTGDFEYPAWYDRNEKVFLYRNDSINTIYKFGGPFSRNPVRPMTRYEILAWVQSPESKGWLVNIRYKDHSELRDNWKLPSQFIYDNYEDTADDVYEYVRAPLLPDLSGVDESKMIGFETEVKEPE